MKQQSRLKNGLCSSAFLLVGLLGCSGMSASFHQTDDTFLPVPIAIGSPAVYFFPKEVPAAPMRSVGIITVVAPAATGSRELARLVAAKGKEVGCWALVEHSVFLLMQSRSTLWDVGPTAKIVLVHGGGGGAGGGHPYESAGESEKKSTFDCLIKDEIGV